jgi:hypothetical protein
MFKDWFSGPVHYKDKWIQLLGIPLITFTAHYLTYGGSDSISWYVYEILSDALKIFLTWNAVKACICFLDRRFPWSGQPLRRLTMQLLLTTFAGLLIFYTLVFIDYGLVRPYAMDHFGFDLVIATLFIVIVNAVYIILYYYESLQAAGQKLADLKKRQLEILKAEYFLVKLGKKEIQIPLSSIGFFYARNKATILITEEGKSYPVDLSLDQLEKETYTRHMFRANRQYLVSAQAVSSIQSDSYGKIAVQLTHSGEKDSIITVSRDKAAAFRQWFKAK